MVNTDLSFGADLPAIIYGLTTAEADATILVADNDCSPQAGLVPERSRSTADAEPAGGHPTGLR